MYPAHLKTIMNSKEIRATIAVRTEDEGALTTALAALNISEATVVQQAVNFALRQIISGIPLGGSLQSSLEGSDVTTRSMRFRLGRAILLAEKVLADQAASVEALCSIVREGKQEGETAR
jgi:hypothetical protein